MNISQKQLMDCLPVLDPQQSKSPKCKVCEADSAIFDSVDFNKHCSSAPYGFGLSGISVPYYRCARCSLIFTDFIDDWNNEEVAKYIYNSDYQKVDPEYVGARPLRAANDMSKHFAGCEQLRFLDYGSGSGLYAERMRELGFPHVEAYDPFSSPAEPTGLYDFITCFEVIEHSPKPLITFIDMVGKLSQNGAIVVGQTLQPSNIEEIGGRWWYVAPRNGHVSFFAEETFITLAERLGLVYHSGTGLYAFSRPEPSKPVANFVRKVGSAMHLLTLMAPGPGAFAPGWHGAEQRGSRTYRWSGVGELSWPELELRTGVNLIQVPFLMSARKGFEEECVLTVDGKRLKTRIQGHRIVGDIEVSKPRTCRVTLLTPPHLTPHELTGAPDNRRLGLAVDCR
jgi:2-polyprenyl-3-methyl-5-hydroxy-6-metoxy-1,4-benzoquinol methylase